MPLTKKEQEYRKVKLRDRIQRDALYDGKMALIQIKSECEESIKYYKDQGWRENKTIGKLLHIAATALRAIETARGQFTAELQMERHAELLEDFDEGVEA